MISTVRKPSLVYNQNLWCVDLKCAIQMQANNGLCTEWDTSCVQQLSFWMIYNTSGFALNNTIKKILLLLKLLWSTFQSPYFWLFTWVVILTSTFHFDLSRFSHRDFHFYSSKEFGYFSHLWWPRIPLVNTLGARSHHGSNGSTPM